MTEKPPVIGRNLSIHCRWFKINVYLMAIITFLGKSTLAAYKQKDVLAS